MHWTEKLQKLVESTNKHIQVSIYPPGRTNSWVIRWDNQDFIGATPEQAMDKLIANVERTAKTLKEAAESEHLRAATIFESLEAIKPT